MIYLYPIRNKRYTVTIKAEYSKPGEDGVITYSTPALINILKKGRIVRKQKLFVAYDNSILFTIKVNKELLIRGRGKILNAGEIDFTDIKINQTTKQHTRRVRW